jgi:4-hydroxy-4-methyl-2-oxoglutarate aldolase
MSSGLAALIERATTSSVCDALMKRGLKQFMNQRIRPLGNSRVAGPALTVERVAANAPGRTSRPNADFVAAVDNAAAGTVLVFNGDPEHEAALWGGLLAAAAVQRQLGGVVADGPVRDPGEIVDLGCPCFCTGSVSAGQAGILMLASIGDPVDCGGIRVRSGDFVFGDVSGVVVIPQGLEHEILEEAVVIEDRDQAAMRLIREGKRLTETMKSLGRA